ncbi:MAG: hypothetical protein JO360_04300 [Acidobacteria bacterium]|nr:hypothetical protein [Acidobacteriota bacterium]
MLTRTNLVRAFLPFAACALLFVAAFAQKSIKPSAGQQDEERQIFFDYAESRPKKSAAGKSKPAAKRRYARKTPKPAQTKETELAQVGITLWKLRPATAKDEKETRILEQEEESDARVELTPVRMEADAPLKVNDKVRLSIESPRAGYLYVIDRELYADGTMSAPYLIFPTQRTRGGDNRVRAGVLIDIPAQNEPAFVLKPSRVDQVAEVLTILVSPQPLDVPPLGRKALKLDEAKVAAWEREWRTEPERFELIGGSGQVWTKEEKAAAADGSRLLDQDDPAPQTIYRVAAKPGNPLMITVTLRYAGANASSKLK